MTHEKIHARVADRATNQEDVWTGDNEWIEGAAIYRKNDSGICLRATAVS